MQRTRAVALHGLKTSGREVVIMPRASSDKIREGRKLFNKGVPMTEIAQKLGVSNSTVRNWKKRYGWGNSTKKTSCDVSEKCDEKNATSQKKKSGGQPGNQNAKYGAGNPHPVRPDRTKHGGYSAVYWDTLKDDEKELIDDMPKDEETLLLEQIQLFSVRERRIMQAINKYREMDSPVAVAFTNRSERKRAFKDEEEEKEYNRIVAEKVAKGERMPGKEYNSFSQTENKDSIIARLESELSNVQSKKTKAIEALARLNIEKQKLAGDTAANDVVKAWAEKVLKTRRGSDGE